LDSLHFRALAVHSVVLVRWLPDSRPEEFRLLSQFIIETAQRSGGKVALISSIAPTSAPPTLGLFEAIVDFARAVRGSLDVAYLVFEGTGGFWQTIVRSIATRMAIVAQVRGMVVYAESFAAALGRACAPRGLDALGLRAMADREGLFEERSGAGNAT
jgi:hypothetical protein